MPTLITRGAFERWTKSLSAVAMATINEALGGPQFRHEVTHSEHRQQIARELLTRSPALLGTLASLASGDPALAVETAHAALAQLRADDPALFWPSRITKAQTRAWVRRTHPHRDASEVWHETDRADDQTNWNSIYRCAHLLASQGRDANAIRDEIAAKLNDQPDTPTIVVPAQTPDGIIAGPGVPYSKIGDTP